jgi:hypothetical protein
LISFFRIFDPLRLTSLAIVLLGLRLPMILHGIPLTVAELSWMLVGEKMAEGAMLYKEIWYQLEPLSAFVYYLINLLFGKSQLAFQLVNILLIFFQSAYLNLVLNKNNVFNERTSIPGLLYILFSSLFFDFYTLSPVVMGITFLLPAFNLLLSQLKINEHPEIIFRIGILTGIASLFYMSLTFYILFMLLVMVLFINPPVRSYFTLLTGFALSYIFLGCYYFMYGGISSLYHNLIHPYFNISVVPVISWHAFILIVLPVLATALMSLMAVINQSKYGNYQYTVFKINIIWILSGSVAMALAKRLEPFHFFMVVLPLTILATHYFIILKNVWYKEAAFLLLAASVILISYGNLYLFLNENFIVDKSEMIVKQPSVHDYKNQKIVVMGYEPEIYLNNKLATPYLSWNLASSHLENMDNYPTMAEVYRHFRKDMPDIIIDKQNVIPKVFYRLPALEKHYVKADSTSIYYRKTLQSAEGPKR